MSLKWVTNPSSNKPDPMLTMSVIVVTVASLKFLLEGVTVTIHGHDVSFGHVDALVYGALLTPVLGVHGYIKARASKGQKVDNPDEQ
jgi:hypothetical protein